MEGYREKDGRIQGERWKNTGRRMEGYREKDGRMHGQRWRYTGRNIEGYKEKVGGSDVNDSVT